MYTSRAGSLERLSAQTVMHHILDTLVRLLAPVLSFTADEVWQYMPGCDLESVHLTEFPRLNPEWKNDALTARWERIIKVRTDVSKALELARTAKVIGHSLDAAVIITAPDDLLGFLREYETGLAAIFIVSKVVLTGEISGEVWSSENIAGLQLQVSAAPGEKCERCWCYSEELGSDSAHATICPICTKAVI
jgi:isoleucyl-tRNA synthetase